MLQELLGKPGRFVELCWSLATDRRDWLIRRRFNDWAKWGRGESMERGHAWMAEKVFGEMNLSPGDRILDLGCGEGWACRLMAPRTGENSRIVGVDISDEMIRRAQAKSDCFPNVTFHCAPAERLPSESNFFNKVVSIEAFYYIQHQDKVLDELFRVMTPGGQLFILVCLYRDEPDSVTWLGEWECFGEVGMPVQKRSAAEYVALLQGRGWVDVQSEVFEIEGRPGAKPSMHDRPLCIRARKPGSLVTPVDDTALHASESTQAS